MKKITIPEELKGKELYQFLIANKEALIAQKKMHIKWAEPATYSPAFMVGVDGALKTATRVAKEIPDDATKIRVKVVANTSMFCDSQMDVLLRDNAKKSIRDRKGLIPHLTDHDHTVGGDAEVGDVHDIYYEDIALSELGYDAKGSGQALIFETDIIKAYNENVFRKYRLGRIKQHSIGLMYVKIGMAINDEEYVAAYELWKKYIDDIINKDYVEDKGFFWAVPEIKLLENSCVLFGSNELTPTLEAKSTEDEPLLSTLIQPTESFDVMEAIKTTKFF